MHYGSIIGMTQYYRPAAAMSEKEERKTVISFGENDTCYFDPSFPTKSMSCPDFNYDHTEESDSEDAKENTADASDEQPQVASIGLQIIHEDQENQPLNDKQNEAETKLKKKKKKARAAMIKDLRDIHARIQNANKSGRRKKTSGSSTKKKENPKEMSVLIDRKNCCQQKSTSLERDHDQLGSAKNLVASRRAMFESLQKNDDTNEPSTNFRNSARW